MFSTFQKHLLSNTLILLWRSAVSVQASQPYKKTDIARECISWIFDLRESFLLCQMCFSLLNAAIVWATLARISGFEPSSDIMAPRYLKVETSSSFCPFIRISFVNFLFAMTLVFSALIYMPHAFAIFSSFARNSFSLSSLQQGRLCHRKSVGWL